VPPGAPAALAEALVELLGDPELRGALGSRNRRLVEERFAWPRVGDRLEALYAGAVSDGAAVRAA
jgi:glycosyltransferase involved in cell wall biosynthesis